MKSYKPITSTGVPEDLVETAISDLLEISDEIEQWKSGMEGTNLESSERYSMLSEAYDTLSNVQAPEPDEWPHPEARVSYTEYHPKRKNRSPSRAMRVENATGRVAALIDFYESLDDAEEHSDLIEELREIADISVELPGMYG